MATLFTTVLDGMENNNEINDASFSDWENAQHALEVYSENFHGECEEGEKKATVEALDLIIDSNGSKYEEAVKAWNIKVWGKDFANNDVSTAFSG